MAIEDWIDIGYDEDGWDEPFDQVADRDRAHERKCKGHKVFRRNRETQQGFWGCSLFPACRWSRSIAPCEEDIEELREVGVL